MPRVMDPIDFAGTISSPVALVSASGVVTGSLVDEEQAKRANSGTRRRRFMDGISFSRLRRRPGPCR